MNLREALPWIVVMLSALAGVYFIWMAFDADSAPKQAAAAAIACAVAVVPYVFARALDELRRE